MSAIYQLPSLQYSLTAAQASTGGDASYVYSNEGNSNVGGWERVTERELKRERVREKKEYTR